MSKKNFTASVLLIAIAILFWTGSRYPRLNAKAAMAGDIPLSETLSFERVIEYDSFAPIHEKFFYSLVNWTATNKKGMFFGFLFGAAFLTLLPTLNIKPSRSYLRNSIIGTLTGAPLGVCVNCAAPIGNAVFKAVGRIEMTLATMVSSPTLNVVIITMLFTMFPVHLILLKLGFTFFTLFVLIPWIARTNEDSAGTQACNLPKNTVNKEDSTWTASIFYVAKMFLKNLVWIVFATGPLMLLAGALGVGLAQAVDLSPMMHEVSFLGLLGVALIGTFLPAPIALDLILAQGFLAAGVNEAYVMALLFTLGIYSVYACFIVWKAVSRRVAMTLYGSVVLMGICSGYMAQFYSEYEYSESLEIFEDEFSSLFSIGVAFGATEGHLVKDEANIPEIAAFVGTQKKVSVFKIPLTTAGNKKEGFTQIWGEQIGLYRPIEFSILDSFTPFYFSRGIAAGDYDNDGFEDIALASPEGIRIFKNMDGKKYVTSYLTDIKNLKSPNVMLVAFVDLNNDGRLDLFGTTYGYGETFWLENTGKGFSQKANLIPNPDAITVNAATFGDLDTDGDLDLVLGNWYMGFISKHSPKQSRNMYLKNNNENFTAIPLPGIPGETLTTLFSDFDSDGKLDLVIGNDFSRPDVFYKGNNKGKLKQISGKNILPHSTKYTMSVDTADINNDLKLDMYFAQITGNFSGDDADDYEEYGPNYCDDIPTDADRIICERNISMKDILLYRRIRLGNVKKCKKLTPKKTSKDCMVQVLTLVAIKENKKELCDKIPADYERNRFWCRSHFAAKETKFTNKQSYVAQIEKRNVLLVAGAGGSFTDRSKAMNVDLAGWSWNAKFADLNNDGWQDLYVANGYWLTPRRYNNSVFLNNKGSNFATPDDGYGLSDSMDVTSYVYTDFDNDGDQDIISVPVNGPMKLFQNNESVRSGIKFSLRDMQGNRFCIGCKVYISTDDGLKQMREIKSGGGFQSFDSQTVHFGVNRAKSIKSVKIVWSDGSSWILNSSLAHSSHYFFVRQK